MALRFFLVFEQLEEAIFQRLMSWCDFVDASTHRNNRRDELWHALRVEVRERYLIALVVDASVLRQAVLVGLCKPAHPHAHRCAAEELVHRSRRDDAPMVDHRHAVADLLDLAQQVRVEEHRRAARRKAADDLPNIVPPDRVEGRCRLIQEDKLRLAKQRGTQAEALLHALGERADAVVGPTGQSNRLQGCLYLVLPTRARQRRELAVQGEHLSCGQPGLIAKELWQVADPAPRAKVSDWPAEQGALSRRRLEEAEQELHRRRLARTVGAEKPEHLTPQHSHGKAGKRDGMAEAFGQLDCLDGRRAGGLPWERGRLGLLC